MSPPGPLAGVAQRVNGHQAITMDSAQPSGLLGLLVIVVASFGIIAYAFLRIAGVIGRRGRKQEHPPPPASYG
jgi:hypothetical protein